MDTLAHHFLSKTVIDLKFKTITKKWLNDLISRLNLSYLHVFWVS